MTEGSATARADSLYARVRSCQRCPLARTRTLAVPGEGPLDAAVLLIGEAPGANEDRQGRPFVGQAGQFLSELLAAAGLRREEVYICNVLKCRPPANRDPLPDEIAQCKAYLDEQIGIIDPLVVVTLGRYSMGRYFPQQSISRIHGSVKLIDSRYYVPMFHPAAALHQQSLRDTILDDFRTLPGVIERARASRRPPAPAPQPAPEPELQPDAPSAASHGTPDLTKPGQIRLFD
jgi:uracil-DNA glycosylase